MTYIDHYNSPLGAMTMASDGENLIGLWFDGQKYDRFIINKVETQERDLPIFGQTKKWLDTYFSGKIPTFTPVLKLSGSPFRQSVGELLLQIPYGEARTYGDLARIIASERGLKTMSAQAVGGAVGHNPISIIIPCHRVIGANGSLTGYAGGIETKLWLLNHEQTTIKINLWQRPQR